MLILFSFGYKNVNKIKETLPRDLRNTELHAYIFYVLKAKSVRVAWSGFHRTYNEYGEYEFKKYVKSWCRPDVLCCTHTLTRICKYVCVYEVLVLHRLPCSLEVSRVVASRCCLLKWFILSYYNFKRTIICLYVVSRNWILMSLDYKSCSNFALFKGEYPWLTETNVLLYAIAISDSQTHLWGCRYLLKGYVDVILFTTH